MKIAVLAGGLSPERDVSLTSGSLIATSLSRSGHAVALVDLYLGLKSIPKDIESLFVKGESYSYKVETAEPDLEALIASNGGRRAPIGEGVLDICRAAGFIKCDGAVHTSMVGQGNSGMSAFLGALGNVCDATCAIQKTVFAMQMKMDKFRHVWALLSL